ncbi:hypothetical protein L6R49_22640, partial [Myxococcota bacterium]|nr:hypothetical protein [Myxococcota bacterium]
PMTEGPAAPIPRLRAAARALEGLEDERRALSRLHGLKTGGVPNWVWALLFLSFCFGLFFANFVVVIFVGSVPWGLLSLVGLGFVAVAESRRRERLAAVDATIAGVRQAMFEDHRALTRASFYARMGGVELESAPQLWWLRRRIADVQRAQRLRPDPALDVLLAALQGHADAITAALTAHQEAEGEFGAEEGLTAPLPALRAALAAQGLPDPDAWI